MSFPRLVLGYHGCLEPLASDLMTGRRAVADWPVSRNKWDWLGEGIYFWEHGPVRAMKWAEDKATKARARGGKDVVPSVIGAVIALGSDDVLDLTDVRFAPALRGVFENLQETYTATGRKLPTNERTDRQRHNLDCLVINSLFLLNEEVRERFSVVRGAFEEGAPVFPGSMVKEQTHIQLAVRNPRAIQGVFRPAFSTK